MNVILPNNKDITNEELLKDIEVTKVEIEAYRNIANGYKALASLPEQHICLRKGTTIFLPVTVVDFLRHY